jgi:hypothetical protein
MDADIPSKVTLILLGRYPEVVFNILIILRRVNSQKKKAIRKMTW